MLLYYALIKKYSFLDVMYTEAKLFHASPLSGSNCVTREKAVAAISRLSIRNAAQPITNQEFSYNGLISKAF